MVSATVLAEKTANLRASVTKQNEPMHPTGRTYAAKPQAHAEGVSHLARAEAGGDVNELVSTEDEDVETANSESEWQRRAFPKLVRPKVPKQIKPIRPPKRIITVDSSDKENAGMGNSKLGWQAVAFTELVC
jgi:hypothetical protein